MNSTTLNDKEQKVLEYIKEQTYLLQLLVF